MKTGTAVVGRQRHATDRIALFSEVQPVGGACTDKKISRLFCAAEVFSNLIHRSESGTSRHANDMCARGWGDGDAMRTT